MKRILALVLICSLLVVGCNGVDVYPSFSESTTTEEVVTTIEPEEERSDVDWEQLSASELETYIVENLYLDLIEDFKSEEYFIENISAKYISKEYLEEVAYNSKANIYFGYTLEEVGEQFQDSNYVFTLGENGETIVQEFEAYDNFLYEKVITDVAIGSGIVLICFTISVVTSYMGATTISICFSAAAKAGMKDAVLDGLISGATSAIVTGIQTQDMTQAMESFAIVGSEGFKWGAFAGILDGAIDGVTNLKILKKAKLQVSLKDAIRIQRESKLPISFIEKIHSMDEYNIYKKAGLKLTKVNNKWVYAKKIDWDFIDQDGLTNAQRVLNGKSPVDKNGIAYEIHHVGQQEDSPFAILTKAEHIQNGNNKILHWNSEQSEVNHGSEWNQTVNEIWKGLLKQEKGIDSIS